MDSKKRSIVNYDGDDDDMDRRKHHDNHGTRSSRHDRRAYDERSKSMSSKNESRREHGHSSHESDRSRTRTHHSTREDSRSRRHKSPSHRRRSRSRSRSRLRERDRRHHHRHPSQSPSRDDSRRSRKHGNCRKSKRDRSHDRATDSHSHRYRNTSPEKDGGKTAKLKEKLESLPRTAPPPPQPPSLSLPEPKQQPIIKNVPRAVPIPVIPVANLPKLPSNKESVLNPVAQQAQDIPKYYNSKMVNTSKIAAQEEKRKLLWGDTKKEKTSTIWANLKFQGEHGSAMTEKFRKLMGIKSNEMEQNKRQDENVERGSSMDGATSKQSELFQNLDMQYSIARMSTHINRGVGLGFGSSSSSGNRLS